MPKEPSKFSIGAAIIIGILAVSTGSIFIRFANQDAPALVIASYRLVLSSIIIAPIALTKHRHELHNLTKNDFILGIISGIFLALHFATWISSLEYTSVTSSVVLVTTTPLWVALLSPLLLKETTGKSVIIGLMLAFLGGIIVAISDSCIWQSGLICPPYSTFIKGSAFWGDFLALCGAWMAAGYMIIGRQLRTKISLFPYIFIVYGMAAVCIVAITISSGSNFLGYSPVTYAWLLLLALIPQLLGHSTFNWALAHLHASVVSITMLGEPIGSTILAYFLLGEFPSGIKLFGSAIILAGIYIASLTKDK